MKHLRLSMYGQSETGDNRHPQVVMRELGITYRYAVPQSIWDQWWFLDCKRVPDELPPYIEPMENFDPQRAVGYGLSHEMADALTEAAMEVKP